jgi:hypothetical protein
MTGGGFGKEVDAVLGDGAVLAHEAQPGFVQESRGLQGMILALAAHVTSGEAVELTVDGGDQIGFGTGVSAAHSGYECRDMRGRCHIATRTVMVCTIVPQGAPDA